jgi:DNA-binding transcriptional regulator/RsmH inhibitor MraZ
MQEYLLDIWLISKESITVGTDTSRLFDVPTKFREAFSSHIEGLLYCMKGVFAVFLRTFPLSKSD